MSSSVPRSPFRVVFLACAAATLVLIPTEGVFAQVVCPGCPDPCAGFVSEQCNVPSGCAGKTVCDRGLRVCDTTGYRVSCSACGAGGFAVCGSRGTPGACQPATPLAAELCNGCDDNANGTVDEGVAPAQCSLPGSCGGVRRCVNGSFGACDYAATSSAPCPGCGDGGTRPCFADGGLGACRPAALGPEGCNSCDDDGDGVVDNAAGSQVPGSVVEICQGASVCSGSRRQCTPQGWSTCVAPAEVCNGLDDNCDEKFDEGDVCLQACTP